MQRLHRLRTLPALLFLALAPVTTAASDLGEQLAQQGNDKGASACTTCHGADGGGNGPAGWPRLAGMNADHLVKQLNDMASGERDNATMNPIAKGLSAEERRAVSEYYAEMEAPTEAPGTDAAQSVVERGRAIAEQGLWRKGVPSCVACHGPGGDGVGADFPALSGQHASYIENQFTAWQDGDRQNDPNELMASVAKRLTEEEIKAVAAWFASQPARPSAE
ncbi:cytochrome c553 [Halospina denitrificans]|uniref:Cytochrome c553 n=1 Tax=Halospina denitrificans TaxID=332522 RepID=A0A4R7K1K8_9GAMM|nr:c-type cytochrome [Halospina denitrificans]TDT44455.1 cytochrome c553 [Halospina denitrificans]